jgi:hypothetical protein
VPPDLYLPALGMSLDLTDRRPDRQRLFGLIAFLLVLAAIRQVSQVNPTTLGSGLHH